MRIARVWTTCALLVGLALPAAGPRAAAQEPPGAREPQAAQEPGSPVGALLARFQRMRGLSASFREERRLALLDVPLVEEGRMYFAPPGRLARHVDRPAPSSLVIEQGRLRLWDGKTTRELALDRSPVARELVAGFLLILAGDEPGLRKLYEIELSALPGEDHWRLVLRPRQKPLSDAIARLEFTGRGLVVEKLLLVETGGDETETTFSEVDPDHAFAPEEAARVFALPAGSAAPPRKE